VLEPFKQLKARGKNTVIVIEGSRDTQKWMVEQLGLAPYVDVLVTSNEIGLAKDAGLFEEVLERCGIRKEDVVPAKAVGVLAALFNERDGYRDVRVGEGNGEDVLRANSLTEIGYWLQDSDSNGQSRSI
jgi:putative hydrolase of the HAD superfamily